MSVAVDGRNTRSTFRAAFMTRFPRTRQARGIIRWRGLFRSSSPHLKRELRVPQLVGPLRQPERFAKYRRFHPPVRLSGCDVAAAGVPEDVELQRFLSCIDQPVLG